MSWLRMVILAQLINMPLRNYLIIQSRNKWHKSNNLIEQILLTTQSDDN